MPSAVAHSELQLQASSWAWIQKAQAEHYIYKAHRSLTLSIHHRVRAAEGAAAISTQRLNRGAGRLRCEAGLCMHMCM